MRILFHSNKNASVLPVLAALLITLFCPVMGKAQGSFAPGGHTGQGDSDIASIAGQLGYNALLVLLGAVVLMGIVFICHVSKACVDLNRPRGNTSRSLLSLLILATGLSAFCSSCSVEQQVMATQYLDAVAAENRACPMNQYHGNQADPAFNNLYPYNGYSTSYSPSFCKYCGKRVFNK